MKGYAYRQIFSRVHRESPVKTPGLTREAYETAKTRSATRENAKNDPKIEGFTPTRVGIYFVPAFNSPSRDPTERGLADGTLLLALTAEAPPIAPNGSQDRIWKSRAPPLLPSRAHPRARGFPASLAPRDRDADRWRGVKSRGALSAGGRASGSRDETSGHRRSAPGEKAPTRSARAARPPRARRPRGSVRRGRERWRVATTASRCPRRRLSIRRRYGARSSAARPARRGARVSCSPSTSPPRPLALALAAGRRGRRSVREAPPQPERTAVLVPPRGHAGAPGDGGRGGAHSDEPGFRARPTLPRGARVIVGFGPIEPSRLAPPL